MKSFLNNPVLGGCISWKAVTRNFLGTSWAFVELHGKAYWLNEKTGTILPSTKNGCERCEADREQPKEPR